VDDHFVDINEMVQIGSSAHGRPSFHPASGLPARSSRTA
jgi:hypothetical protein